MKQNLRSAIILLASSLLFIGTIVASEPPKEPPKKDNREEIRIEDLVHSGNNMEPERSLVPTVAGILNYATQTIQLEFKRPLGEVVVTITNTQDIVVFTTRSSTATPILLPLPAVGEYEITIEGENYSGVSNFVID